MRTLKRLSVLSINVWATWGVATAALLVSGLSYCEARRANNLAEEAHRASSILIWQAKTKDGGNGLSLVQPDQNRSIQVIRVSFPKSIRRDVIVLSPGEAELLETWVQPGMGRALNGRATPGFVNVIEGIIPIQIETNYHSAERGYAATQLYSLFYRASADDIQLLTLDFTGLAFAGGAKKPLTPENLEALWTAARRPQAAK